MRGWEARSTQRHGNLGVGQNPNKSKFEHTTFFFSNFPHGFGELDMHMVFQKWGRVKEVFIARRLNKCGRRFGFVRFFDVRNVVRLEKELDKIYIGNLKLYVNILKYRIYDPNVNGLPFRANKKPESESLAGARKWGFEWQGGKGREMRKEVWVDKKGNQSFVDIVKGGSRQEWKGPIISTQNLVLPWMKFSVIG